MECNLNQLKLVCFLSVALLSSARLMASSEIDIDTDVSSSAAQPAPTVADNASGSVMGSAPVIAVTTPIVDNSAPVPTPTAGVKGLSTMISEEISDHTAERPVPTALVVHGILKMKDVYKAGLSYYKKQDFAKAIRYLKESLKVQDPYTPKYYYAEANAMLGVIYQFHIIDKDLAYSYYKEALAIDPETATARKHIRELSGSKGSK